MKFAIIGLGGWVNYGHLPALNELGIKVDYCVDIDEKRVKDFSQRTGCKGYTDYKDMLTNENPDIVLVAVPHGLHAKIALDALNNDANVYVEKPMATSLQEALSLVDTARKRNRILVVGHEFRFEQTSMITKKLIKDLGNIYHIRGLYVRQRGIPTSVTFIKKDLAKGGVIFDLATHIIDLIMFFTNFPTPRTVKAKIHYAFSKDRTKFSSYPSPNLPNSDVEVEDSGSAFIDLGEISAYVEVSWASYIKENKREIVILGNNGGIHIENNALYYMRNIADEFFISNPLIQQRGSVYREVWSSLFNAVAKGETRPQFPFCTAEQGAINVAILESIYKSAFEGREVKVEIPSYLIELARSSLITT
ncbi:MAG: Gfo/Idh/MocA family oxidoreductase [Saccharolobus sp.]|jgi:predicted dehydrogenase|uniref:Gfo/Idh/MocA family protein n=1 Tax=Saccharolobus sp. TaxID=2100761 RepID=UPI0028CFBAEE|nr:Gfo/Idh/MocA family oxidoreductase [Saccharolobus sp.]MDT7862407.1 Gfo/Idh/MocA family oxidoreductase [Saccharolobus sp.]